MDETEHRRLGGDASGLPGKPDVKKPPELNPDPKPPASLAPAELIEALEFPAGTTLAEAIGEIEARSDFDPGAKLQEMAGMLDELASLAKQQAERLPDVIPIRPGMGDLLREYYDFVPRYSSDSVRLAAGINSVVDQEDLAGHVAFRKTGLGSNGLRAKNLSLVDVMGDSMEPKLLDGDSVLVNHASREPIEGRVFAISTGDGPLVKRLRQEGAGGGRTATIPTTSRVPWVRMPESSAGSSGRRTRRQSGSDSQGNHYRRLDRLFPAATDPCLQVADYCHSQKMGTLRPSFIRSDKDPHHVCEFGVTKDQEKTLLLIRKNGVAQPFR